MKNRMLTFGGAEMTILDLLSAKPNMYGMELIEASRGRLKRGTVYVTLGRMEDKGYIESEQEPPRPGAIGLPRRLYRLTPRGVRVLEAWSAARATLSWEGLW